MSYNLQALQYRKTQLIQLNYTSNMDFSPITSKKKISLEISWNNTDSDCCFE